MGLGPDYDRDGRQCPECDEVFYEDDTDFIFRCRYCAGEPRHHCDRAPDGKPCQNQPVTLELDSGVWLCQPHLDEPE